MADPEVPPPTGRTAFADDPRFAELRRAYRGFVFPVTAAFLVWYLTYVAFSAYARGFMATKLTGNINVALVFGLLQFVSTFAIALAYGRFADRRLDPLGAELRAAAAGTASGSESAADTAADTTDGESA